MQVDCFSVMTDSKNAVRWKLSEKLGNRINGVHCVIHWRYYTANAETESLFKTSSVSCLIINRKTVSFLITMEHE
jgi:hypothetical protein